MQWVDSRNEWDRLWCIGSSISVRVLLTGLQISVAGLRSKMDKVSAFENVFFGKPEFSFIFPHL